MKSQREEIFFFEKKKQKTFVTWNAPTTPGALQLTKFFCFFLFTKRRLLLFTCSSLKNWTDTNETTL